MHTDDFWWNAIDPQLLTRIDGLLRTHRLVHAVVLLRKEWEQQPRPGLYEAQDLLMERRAELDRQGLIAPWPQPPTTGRLIEMVASVTAPVVAVEAFWDGDTQGWFVVLVAVVRRPGPRHERFDEVTLTTLTEGREMPLSDGQVPLWPEAQQAIAQGRAVAQHFGVPFHFASPHERNDDLPRWWDTRSD